MSRAVATGAALAPQVLDVAFVIPAYNEEKFISATLASIERAMAGRSAYEVVVVDNGSSDRTAELARAAGARVLIAAAGTVGALRNLGARHATARALVFLDADVELTDSWGENIHATLRELRERPATITGSHCGIPANASWLERYWFAPRRSERVSHMNSGHLIVDRAYFEQLGGFAAEMQTGEDYEFSRRALEHGADLIDDARLPVVHHGFPRTLRAFLRREVWHGLGDAGSVRAIVTSPIASAALMFVVLHAVLVVALLRSAPDVAATSLISITLTCLGAAIHKCPGEPFDVILRNALVYYAYFWARAAALVRARAPRFVQRESR